ncbi:hypothetical protein ATO46_18110 [Aeromonas schubertii]|uniref:hypothetical protein n=1 Tax=Aeromonas schubertii TaxID=652 RepID=UPI00067F1759|nr:hypothetical protein [Aeromonas schubertii]KUE79761.1 hypothetical protein ATO46_18110 [Aeromonas schubertii]
MSRTHARIGSLTHITRFIEGNWLTRFYALWILRRASGWSLWLGCPRSNVVRLTPLWQRRPSAQDERAIVIPMEDWVARHPDAARRGSSR